MRRSSKKISAVLLLVAGWSAMSSHLSRLRTEAGLTFVRDTASAFGAQATQKGLQSVVPPPGAQILGFAMADFGGDSRPDLAAVEMDWFDSRFADYRIDIRLTEGGRQNLRLIAPPGGLFITPTDVTGDGNLDLVVSATHSGNLVGVFVNDGKGHFEPSNLAGYPTDLRRISSQSTLTARQIAFSTTFANPESHALDRQVSWIRFRRDEAASFLLATHRVSGQHFLHYGINRAPPSTI